MKGHGYLSCRPQERAAGLANRGELKAYRGRCPHADLPLSDASFNGQTVTCPIHQWVSTAAAASA